MSRTFYLIDIFHTFPFFYFFLLHYCKKTPQASSDVCIALMNMFFSLCLIVQRSRRSSGSVEHLIHGNRTDQPAMGGLYDARFIKVWFQVNLRPQLPTLSKYLLSCLSKGNLSCESYQALYVSHRLISVWSRF